MAKQVGIYVRLSKEEAPKDKHAFKVLNRYSENKITNSKDIEKRLFQIFKKYENLS